MTTRREVRIEYISYSLGSLSNRYCYNQYPASPCLHPIYIIFTSSKSQLLPLGGKSDGKHSTHKVLSTQEKYCAVGVVVRDDLPTV